MQSFVSIGATMLKDDGHYDYVEVEHREPPAPTLSALRKRAKKGPSLPTGPRLLKAAQSIPLQSYLQERFSHIGRKDDRFRALRAENQRRHDVAASLGHWQMSRTS